MIKILKETQDDAIKIIEARNLNEKIIIDKDGNISKVLLDDEGNIVNEEDIIYEEEEYMDENGNILNQKHPKRIVKEIEEIDEFGNVRQILKEVEECGVIKVPETRKLKEKAIIDKDGNITKVLLDDEGNIVNEEDFIYEEEEYIDENGNKAIKKVPKIKTEVFNNLKEKEECMLNQKRAKRIVKEIEEIDEFGNVRKILKEVEE